jgi:uncharacterized alpha-E superfamily protein
MENTSDYFMPRPLLFCMKSEKSVCYSVPDNKKRSEVKEEARRLRRKFLRYQQAEIVYSLSHKKLMELANDAGAIYRMDGIVLINREIFDEYLEQFHEK